MSKVTLELRICHEQSPEMSYLHKVQVNRSGSSVQTEKVKLHRKKEVGAYSKIFVCWLDSSCLKLHMRFHKLVHFIHIHMLGDFNASLLARLHLPLLPHNNDCQLARWSLFNAQIETKRLIGTLSWNTYAWLTSKRTCIFYWQAAIGAYTPPSPAPP